MNNQTRAGAPSSVSKPATKPTVAHVVTGNYHPRDGVVRAAGIWAEACSGYRHVLVVNKLAEKPDEFDELFSYNGHAGFGPLWQPWKLRKVLEETGCSIVHMHGGVLSGLVLKSRALRDWSPVVSVYDWQKLPSFRAFNKQRREERKHSSVKLMRAAGGGFLGKQSLKVAAAKASSMFTTDSDVRLVCPEAELFRAVVREVNDEAQWNNEPLVVFAGKAEQVRGVGEVLEAWPEVKKIVKGARLRLCLLPGSQAEIWAEQGRTLDGVEVTLGKIDVDEVFKQAQVGVYIFHWNGTIVPSLAALETMAHGVPIVGSNAKGIKELLQDGGGSVANPITKTSIVTSLVSLLIDEETWQEQSTAAAKAARNWCLDDQSLHVMEEAYKKALNVRKT